MFGDVKTRFPLLKNGFRRFGIDLVAEAGFGEIFQVGSVTLLSFLGQFRIDFHDHGGVCMTHPGLQCLDLHVGFIAYGAEGDAEIMAADMDVFPGR